jgi:hypothetical protein
VQKGETCAGCRFFAPSSTIECEGKEVDIGHCRRHVPRKPFFVSQDWFPSTWGNDWCGDFEASGQEKGEDAQPAKVEGLETVQKHLSALRGQR